jgi:hypothetical protein
MTHSELFFVWACIVTALFAIASVVIPLTAWQAHDNMRRIQELMDAHERNLRSHDPKTRADSQQRWRTMCRTLQGDNVRFSTLWLDLERWGEEAAKRTVP